MSSKRAILWAAIGGAATVAAWAVTATAGLQSREYKSGIVWPEPKMVTPGKTSADPPSDAIVLFDGKDLSKWKNGEKWEIKDGYATAKGGDITTKEAFGDC